MPLQRYAIVLDGAVVNVVEYESQPTTPPPGFEEGYFAVLANNYVGPGWTYSNGQFTRAPVPAEQLVELCRQNALRMLTATDWVELPSVTDTNLTPHLINKADFIAYRSAIRNYAVNPTENPVWPALPTEQWST